MFSGEAIAAAIAELGVTHVVWLPDSALGPWEAALESSPAFKLVRVCREGEAWAIAAGLQLGGQRPLVIMQTTGLYESGDALRNVLFDLKLPIYAMVGHRSYMVPNTPDTATKFAEPILRAWGLDYVLLAAASELPNFAEHFRACAAADKPGVALVAEGRM